ncbi:MAG: hypothetical protein IKN16_11755, partial [Selenomonadaceae bacterium]|nr:hypothetical protein [Selenomonadaceae bacterium]
AAFQSERGFCVGKIFSSSQFDLLGRIIVVRLVAGNLILDDVRFHGADKNGRLLVKLVQISRVSIGARLLRWEKFLAQVNSICSEGLSSFGLSREI